MRIFLAGHFVANGTTVTVPESTKLSVAVQGANIAPGVTIADDVVPLCADGPDGWSAPAEWVESAATVHLVGDCDLHAVGSSGETIRATLRRVPSRITELQFRFLLDELHRRVGNDIRDPFGRSRIWQAAAPRTPTLAEERAGALLALFERAAPALRAIASRPLPSLVREEEWRPVSKLAGVRTGDVDSRRFRPADPPWPPHRPTRGAVALRRATERVDTAENRYCIGTVRMLLDRLASTFDDGVSEFTRQRLRQAAVELGRWFGTQFWRDLPAGGAPLQSFVMRDHPDYQVMAWLGSATAHLARVTFGLPPAISDGSLAITPWSLNVLYERWIQCLAREWIEARLGVVSETAQFGRSYTWNFPGGRTVVRLDVAYPRRARTGLFAPVGKNRPDAAIEVWRGDEPTQVAVLEATYSRSLALHREKLAYAQTIRDASVIEPLTGRQRLAARWAAVAYPGPATAAEELASDATQVLLSIPPSAEGSELLHRWLARTVGQLI